MTERDMAVTGETVSYSYRPSLLGASREFSLTGHSIVGCGCTIRKHSLRLISAPAHVLSAD